MDPISMLQNIVDLGFAVKQIVDDMSSNKAEGKNLAHMIQRLMPLIETLQRRSVAEMNASQMGPSLDHLVKLLEEAGEFLVQISPPKVNKGMVSKFLSKVATTAKKAWNSASIVEYFVDLNSRFDQILLELSTKEIFKVGDSVSELGEKLTSSIDKVCADVLNVGKELGGLNTRLQENNKDAKDGITGVSKGVDEVNALLQENHKDMKNQIAEMKQLMLLMLQSGNNVEAFLNSNSAQAREIMMEILRNSNQLKKLAAEEEAADSPAPSFPTKSTPGAAQALLLLVDLAQLKWNKEDKEKRLGRGTFGTVYKCTYMDEECAIKHFDCLDKQQPTAHELRKIKREALIMQLASLHYNVIGFKGASVEIGVLVMELASIPLFDLLHRPEKSELLSLSPEQKSLLHGARWKIAIMLDIARALVYIHTHKILHRDLKTPNVLLVYDLNRVAVSGLPFVAKVSDFGLASAVGLSSSEGRSADRERGAVGSTPYMAPELLDFEGSAPIYTSAVDMYSYGILCNEMLSKQIPWLGLKEVQILNKVANKKERPIAHKATCAAEGILMTSVIGTSNSNEACCLHQEATSRPSATSLCCGERAVLSRALALCAAAPHKTGIVAKDVLEKIGDALVGSFNDGTPIALSMATEKALELARAAKAAEIARAAEAKKVAEAEKAAEAESWLHDMFNALGEEVVKVAATMRQDALQGLVRAMQDALWQLSTPLFQEEASPAQMIRQLSYMQTHIETALTKSIPAAGRQDAAVSFRTNFTILICHLRRFTDDQVCSQAATSDAEAQCNQRLAQQMLQCLTSSMRTVLSDLQVHMC